MKYNSDIKILHLIDILKAHNIIRFDTDFCRSVGLPRQNLPKIRNGINKHFTPRHIENVIKIYKVNANWIFGVSDKIFINDNKSLDKNSRVQIRAQN